MNPMDVLQNMQNLQGKMAEMQQKLTRITVEGSSGGGMVKMKLNGKMEVLSVSIAPEAVDPEDLQMLEDLIQGAANSALRELQEVLKHEAADLTGGLNIPGFPGM